jgi:hypothetical protein
LPPFVISTGKISAALFLKTFFAKKNEVRDVAMASGMFERFSASDLFPLNCVYSVAQCIDRSMLHVYLGDQIGVHMVSEVVEAIEACDTIVVVSQVDCR